MPGFVSSSVLTAKDGGQAINYSQWKSADDIAGFRRDPRFAPYIQQLLALAKAEAIECDVATPTRLEGDRQERDRPNGQCGQDLGALPDLGSPR